MIICCKDCKALIYLMTIEREETLNNYYKYKTKGYSLFKLKDLQYEEDAQNYILECQKCQRKIKISSKRIKDEIDYWGNIDLRMNIILNFMKNTNKKWFTVRDIINSFSSNDREIFLGNVEEIEKSYEKYIERKSWLEDGGEQKTFSQWCSGEIKSNIEAILRILKDHGQIDYHYDEDLNCICSVNNDIFEKNSETIVKEQIKSNNPKCPTCGSENIEKISNLNRMASVGLWGLSSSNVGKTMKCNHCGYKW